MERVSKGSNSGAAMMVRGSQMGVLVGSNSGRVGKTVEAC
jgi:hypothetical protein